MRLTMPEYCLVVLVGASGSGKSIFAQKHFLPTEVLSSDYCRGLVSDNESDQDATDDAFDVLFYIVRKRLAARRLTVIDATNVRHEDRQQFVKLAREYHALSVAIVFDLPETLCQERNVGRPEREFGPHVVRNQTRLLRRSLRRLRREGFRYDYRLSSPEEVEAVLVQHEGISECSVIGVPDEKWGEIVVACIVANNIPPDEEALDNHVRSSRLADYKRPRVYQFVDELPKNAANKVLRRLLRERAAE